MHDEDPYIIDLDTTLTSTYDTVTVPSVSAGTLTLTMPEEEDLFVKTPDYDSRKVKQELGIDMIQEIKRSFGE